MSRAARMTSTLVRTVYPSAAMVVGMVNLQISPLSARSPFSVRCLRMASMEKATPNATPATAPPTAPATPRPSTTRPTPRASLMR